MEQNFAFQSLRGPMNLLRLSYTSCLLSFVIIDDYIILYDVNIIFI